MAHFSTQSDPPTEAARIVDPVLVGQYRIIHATQRYGADCHTLFLQHVLACVRDLHAKSVLEFGCGQSRLFEAPELSGIRFYRYDPAIPELAYLSNDRVDLIINTDVMEHIPEQDVKAVLQAMRERSQNVFFHISNKPAGKFLPNGVNAHCTVWPAAKWLEEIQAYFPNASMVYENPGLCCTITTWSSPVGLILHHLEVRRQAEKLARKEKKRPKTVIHRITRRITRLLSGGKKGSD